jgi:hypothetical protein
VLARQPEESERALDILLRPRGQPRIAGRPFAEPSGEIGPGLGQLAAVVEPAQLLEAVGAVLSRQVVERVPEEVNVAALQAASGITSPMATTSRHDRRIRPSSTP